MTSDLQGCNRERFSISFEMLEMGSQPAVPESIGLHEHLDIVENGDSPSSIRRLPSNAGKVGFEKTDVQDAAETRQLDITIGDLSSQDSDAEFARSRREDHSSQNTRRSDTTIRQLAEMNFDRMAQNATDSSVIPDDARPSDDGVYANQDVNCSTASRDIRPHDNEEPPDTATTGTDMVNHKYLELIADGETE